jgi:hypothetical protein
VQDGTHFVGWQIDIGLTVIAQNETVTVPVAGNRSFKFGEQAGALAAAVSSCFDK